MVRHKVRFNAILEKRNRYTVKDGECWKSLRWLVTDEHGNRLNGSQVAALGINTNRNPITVSGYYQSPINETIIDEQLKKDRSQRRVFEIDGSNQTNSYGCQVKVESVRKVIYPSEIINKSGLWKMMFLEKAGLSKRLSKKLALNKDTIVQENGFGKQVDPLDIIFSNDEDQAIEYIKSLDGMNHETSVRVYSAMTNRKNELAKYADDKIKFERFKILLKKTGSLYNLTDEMLSKIFEYKIMGSKERLINLINDINVNIYEALINITGIDFDMIDQVYLDVHNNHTYDDTRARAFVKHSIVEYTDKKQMGFVPLEKLKFKIRQDERIIYANDEIKKKTIKASQKAIAELCNEQKIFILKIKNSNKSRVLLRNEYYFEKNLIDEISHLSKQNMESIDEKFISLGIKQAEEEQGFAFTDEQIKVIRSVVSDKISTINGFAGTGKSSILRAVDKILMNAYGEDSVIQCAFTGRAADSLARSTGVKARTAHSYLRILSGDREILRMRDRYSKLRYSEFDDAFIDDGNKFFKELFKNLGKQLKGRRPPEKDIGTIIIDEYPTMDIAIFASLLHIADEMNYRMILIGDSEQLPAIRISTDLVVNDHKDIVHHKLSAIQRQSNDSDIYNDSLEVRSGKTPELFNQDHSKGKDLIYHKDTNELIKKVANRYKELIQKEHVNKQDLVILAALNKDVHAINRKIHNELYSHRFDPDGFTIGMTERELYKDYQERNGEDPEQNLEGTRISVFEGELVVNTQNFYDKIKSAKDDGPDMISVYNGNVGIVKEIKTVEINGQRHKQMIVDFGKNLGMALYDSVGSQAKYLELAYAITVHRSQGSTIKDVIVALRKAGMNKAKDIYSKQLLYTAMTRASDFMDVYIDDDTMNDCISHNVHEVNKTSFDILERPDGYDEIHFK